MKSYQATFSSHSDGELEVNYKKKLEYSEICDNLDANELPEGQRWNQKKKI